MRNGGNPLKNEELGREAHWFDGDGMLSGVLFRRVDSNSSAMVPEFVNQYLLTDVYLAAQSSRSLRRPILPSVATFINPVHSVFTVIHTILRTLLLVLMSHLPGSTFRIKRISVANTSVLYHDGRVLATCENGPPLRVLLPDLKTVGWFNGRHASNEPAPVSTGPGFGDLGPLNFMTEWTTGHPHVDPQTGELITFHNTFVPPFVRYSVVPASGSSSSGRTHSSLPIFNAPVPGVSGPKIMHDFGVSAQHTVILDLPLTLDPRHVLKGKPMVEYDAHGASRFGVFPRRNPAFARWFETRACCVFHTANTWETKETSFDPVGGSQNESTVVQMLACRLNSASIMYSAGNLPTPATVGVASLHEEPQCRLYYYEFPLGPADNQIRHQWALSAIPFDFPTLRPSHEMSAVQYVYGCTTAGASFNAALGRAAKIDAIAKIHVLTLISRGRSSSPRQVDGCVDTRSVQEIIQQSRQRSSGHKEAEDPIQVFALPTGWCAQEPRFVGRRDGKREDDGWLLTYVFNENTGIDPSTGACYPDARSELWIIDARSMRHVVARVQLPQRVPYGLHGNWFSEKELRGQRPISGVRTILEDTEKGEKGGIRGQVKLPWRWRLWMLAREKAERSLA